MTEQQEWNKKGAAARQLSDAEAHKKALRAWRKATRSGIFSGGAPGCLLILSSIVVLLCGAVVTYVIVLEPTSRGELAGGTPSIRRTTAFMLGIPSIILGLAAFYLLSPVFFRLVKNKREYLP